MPILKWYKYDLDWWGLDYPPLTAYHSWICGAMQVFTMRAIFISVIMCQLYPINLLF